MSDEIQITIRGTLTNGTLKRKIEPGTVTFDQATAASYSNTASLTSNSTALTVGLSSIGWAFFTNGSTAANITIGPSSSAPCFVVPKSGTIALTLGTTALAAKTDTGTADLYYEFWST